MEGTHATASYRSYWLAWAVLLCITLAMVFTGSPAVLLVGIAIKAWIIAWFFMHLRSERFDFALWVLLLMLFMGLLLFGLIVPDARVS